jgi:hypothetical protein
LRDPSTGTWHRATTASTATDPRTAFAVLGEAQGVSRSGNDFRFTLPSAAVARLLAGTRSPGAGTGVAQVVGGTISTLRIDLSAGGKPVTVSLAYESVGSAPPVAVPVATA